MTWKLISTFDIEKSRRDPTRNPVPGNSWFLDAADLAVVTREIEAGNE
jgi:hypothetical protein